MVMEKALPKFLFRWAVSALGLWIAAALLGEQRLSVGDSWGTVVVAGLILALVNMAVKPLLVFLSLPAILITLGLFMLVVNGATILIAAWLYEPLNVSGFWVAVLAGLILGLVNFLVTKAAKDV